MHDDEALGRVLDHQREAERVRKLAEDHLGLVIVEPPRLVRRTHAGRCTGLWEVTIAGWDDLWYDLEERPERLLVLVEVACD